MLILFAFAQIWGHFKDSPRNSVIYGATNTDASCNEKLQH